MQRRNFISTLLGIISSSWIATSQATAKVTQPHTPKKNPSSKSGVPSHIADWLRIPQQPLLELSEVLTSDRETASVLFHHIHKGTPLSITYHGGTQPNTKRSITPVLLFQKIPNPYTLTDQPHPFANRVRPKPFTRPPAPSASTESKSNRSGDHWSPFFYLTCPS